MKERHAEKDKTRKQEYDEEKLASQFRAEAIEPEKLKQLYQRNFIVKDTES